jgi:4-amino-4-deoxy-L-arabinose transferase-like glycosyltransferase
MLKMKGGELFSSSFTHQTGEERADATEQEPSNSTTTVWLSTTSKSLQGPGERATERSKQPKASEPPFFCPHFTQHSRARQSPPFPPPFFFFLLSVSAVFATKAPAFPPFSLLLSHVPFKKRADSVVLLALLFLILSGELNSSSIS